MTLRPFPAHCYRVEDPGDTRIPDLEKALVDANDLAARRLRRDEAPDPMIYNPSPPDAFELAMALACGDER